MIGPVTKVAIVGASGRIGGFFARSLVEQGKHTVTGLTRANQGSKLPEGVKAAEVDYDDESSLVNALKGQQFLIISLGVRVADDLHNRICAAAGKAGVPYIMPNLYGYPLADNSADSKDPYTQVILSRVKDVAANGVSTAIKISCGFWYEWSLALGNQWFGFQVRDRKVTFFDDGKRTITVSTWDQCGRAVAGLLALPESGPSPSLADFKTKDVLIKSFDVSQRDMLDSLHRVLGTTDADWDISYEAVDKRINDGAEEMKQGQFTGFAKLLYGQVFVASNPLSDYGVKMELANGALGLPKEELDDATKTAVDMVNSGWSPFS